MNSKKIVIVGGGFAGIYLAKHLCRQKGYQVTVVDKNNYNFFTPLLYQVATGLLDVSSISIPFRTLFKNRENLHFRLGELKKVIPNKNRIILSNGELSYDYLVIAIGTKPNYFGIENIRKNALPMKSVGEAVKMRNYLISEAEKYSCCFNPVEKRKMQNIVIAGAGPSGVEVAGMLAEMRNYILDDIYPEIDHEKMHIYLVDAAPTVLPPMQKKSQQYALRSLRQMGIKVKLDKMVTDYKNDTVYFKDGETIETKTLIWTAGVTALRIKGLPEDSYKKGNRLQVNAYNKVSGTDNIFAIGDACVQTSDPNFPKGHPQLASVAMQQGKALARNFVLLRKERELRPFRYNDKGTLAIIGRSRAVADLTRPKTTLTGWIAWISWLFVHLFLLINYRNRIQTMWNWFNAYIGKGRSKGLLVGEGAHDALYDNSGQITKQKEKLEENKV